MVNKKLVIGIIGIWCLILLGFIGYKQYTLQTGTEVLLKTVPVDPRDLFRGDYVVLRYGISRIHLDSLMMVADTFEKGAQFYLKLDTSGMYAEPIEISKEKFDKGLFMKGTVISSHDNMLNAKYGIETYFVRQGTGKIIERQITDLEVNVAIDKNGNALIKALYMANDTL